MKPLLYILRKNIKNSIRELKKKPLALILYLLVVIGIVSIIISSFFTPSNTFKRGTVEVFGAIASTVIAVGVYYGIKQGITSGGSFFRFADVNLFFTAPVSPKIGRAHV